MKAYDFLKVASDPRAYKALMTWPRFSVKSYLLVSSVERQGIAPKTIIDVGANIGQFGVAAAKLFDEAHVHSFEPIPECITKLEKNAAKLKNLTVYPYALGDEVGETTININTLSYSSSLLHLAPAHIKAFPEAKECGSAQIKVSTLDQVFSKIDFPTPALLKIDVQGYEAHVIKGGLETLGRIDHIVLETSFKPMYEGESVFMDIAELMSGNGFEFLRPVGWLEDSSTDEIVQMDALFKRQT